MRFFILLFFTLFLQNPSHAEGYSYQCRKEGNQIIHIVILNPKKYEVAFIKAHDQVFGRERLQDIVKRTGADIALNAGFFEIGDTQDGMPSGTLIIDNQVFGLNLKKHDCLSYDQKEFKIQELTPCLEVQVGKQTIKPNKVNKYAEPNDIVLYTDAWGKRTLTPLQGRKEIIVLPPTKIKNISKEGNNVIPEDGVVLSLPSHYLLEIEDPKEEAQIRVEPPFFSKQEKKSFVMGIPILIQDGKINPNLAKSETSFSKSPHARTALGIRDNGEIVIISAEHAYQKPVSEITLENVQSLIHDNKNRLTQKYKKPLNALTLAELKGFIKEEMTIKSVIGLTLPELASLMLALNCTSAINLDGGGSSTLFLKGQIVNHPTGDQDESRGKQVIRPISNALVFKSRKSG